MQEIKHTGFSFTQAVFYLIVAIFSWMILFYPPGNIIAFDVFGYYLYLPLTFKYHDLTIQNVEMIHDIIQKYKGSDSFYQAFQYENGNYVIRYPMGLAVLYSPFYFIGDIAARLSNYPADGFSAPYQMSLLYGCFLYTLAGIYFVKKILQRSFSDGSAAISLAAVALGTNYFFHTVLHGQGAMPHNLLFTLYAILVYCSILWHEESKLRYMIFISLAAGLISLSRASELVCLLIPFLIGVKNISSFRERIRHFLKEWRQMLIGAGIVFVIGSLQLIYYKFTTGKFFINAYGISNPGEALEIFHPHMAEVLVSFRKGWLIYTPIMIFSVIGFFFMRKKKDLFFPILIYFLLNFWIVSSWSCWWYANSFGMRALIPSYAVLCIPFACFVEFILTKKKFFQRIFYSLCFFFTAINLFQSWQVYSSIIDTANMSRDYYFSTFLQTKGPTPEQTKLLLHGKSDSEPETFTAYDSLTHSLDYARWENFESYLPDPGKKSNEIVFCGKFSLDLDSIVRPSFSMDTPMDQLPEKSYTWIKASVWAYSEYPADSLTAYFEVYMQHKSWLYRFRQMKITDKNFIKGKWNKLVYYYRVPDGLRSRKEKICVLFENRCKRKIYIDHLMIESYSPIIDRSVF
jgi:hypothetical protein